MMLSGYWWFAVDGGVCGDACDFIFWFDTVGFGLWIAGCCLMLLGCVC